MHDRIHLILDGFFPESNIPRCHCLTVCLRVLLNIETILILMFNPIPGSFHQIKMKVRAKRLGFPDPSTFPRFNTSRWYIFGTNRVITKLSYSGCFQTIRHVL
ncbi:hypothetical protein HanRHA438_Chr02g0058191 [Helianthus annuus]|nr:hypothetical protein HanRHA438_Chr02g0058191 [Helianthus annuus]